MSVPRLARGPPSFRSQGIGSAVLSLPCAGSSTFVLGPDDLLRSISNVLAVVADPAFCALGREVAVDDVDRLEGFLGFDADEIGLRFLLRCIRFFF